MTRLMRSLAPNGGYLFPTLLEPSTPAVPIQRSFSSSEHCDAYTYPTLPFERANGAVAWS